MFFAVNIICKLHAYCIRFPIFSVGYNILKSRINGPLLNQDGDSIGSKTNDLEFTTQIMDVVIPRTLPMGIYRRRFFEVLVLVSDFQLINIWYGFSFT